MPAKKFEFWQKFLTYANVMTLFVGIFVAFAGNSFLFEIHNNYTQDLFFEGKELPENALFFKNWLFGIIGATTVGFHLMMIAISENAFKKKEKWAYYTLCLGLLSWFLIDSSISAYYGAIYNLVLINLPALIIIGIPLLATRKEFV